MALQKQKANSQIVKTYPWGLANDAVNSFVARMGRAPDIIARGLGQTPKSYETALKELFMKDNRSWNRVRDAIKAVKRANSPSFNKAIPAKLLQKCLTDVEYQGNITEKPAQYDLFRS